MVQLESLEASWLIQACVVLHNMCIEWGLQALKPKDSHDPEIELKIQQEVVKQFLRSLPQNRDRSVVEVRHRKRDREEYLAGVRPRNNIYYHHLLGGERGGEQAGEQVREQVGEQVGEQVRELGGGVDVKKRKHIWNPKSVVSKRSLKSCHILLFCKNGET